MALSSGAGPHQAWLSVNGGTFLILEGSVEQRGGVRKISTFHASIPMDLPGAEATMAGLGDNTATISCVTRGLSGTLIVGEIDRVDFDYNRRLIAVSGRGLGAKLNEMLSSEKWVNKMGSDIVADLAGRVGLGFSGDSSSVMAGKKLVQDFIKLSDNNTFAFIIQKCAELDGAKWWVDNNGTLNYTIGGGGTGGSYAINYQFSNGQIVSDCIHLRINFNVQAGKSIQVKVQAWHPYDKQVYRAQVTHSGNGGPIVYTYNLPTLQQDHVQQHARSRAAEIARHKIRIDATVAGDPTLNPSMMLQVNGTDFPGSYEIDCVTHHVGEHGHVSHITARLPGEDADAETGSGGSGVASDPGNAGDSQVAAQVT